MLSLLSGLVNRSLVVVVDGPNQRDSPDQAHGPRYRLLESVAAYCMQRARQAGEYAEVRRRHRHRHFYSDLAGRAASRLRGYDQRAWLRCLDAETANMRTALDSAIRDGDVSAASGWPMPWPGTGF